MPQMSGGDAVIGALLAHGIKTIYCLPGIQNDHLFNAMFDVGAGLEDVGRDFEADRARPAGAKLPERLVHLGGRILRRLDALGPFGQCLQYVELTGDFMQQAMAPADELARNLSDQGQHRRAGRVGGR